MGSTGPVRAGVSAQPALGARARARRGARLQALQAACQERARRGRESRRAARVKQSGLRVQGRWGQHRARAAVTFGSVSASWLSEPSLYECAVMLSMRVIEPRSSCVAARRRVECDRTKKASELRLAVPECALLMSERMRASTALRSSSYERSSVLCRGGARLPEAHRASFQPRLSVACSPMFCERAVHRTGGRGREREEGGGGKEETGAHVRVSSVGRRTARTRVRAGSCGIASQTAALALAPSAHHALPTDGRVLVARVPHEEDAPAVRIVMVSEPRVHLEARAPPHAPRHDAHRGSPAARPEERQHVLVARLAHELPPALVRLPAQEAQRLPLVEVEHDEHRGWRVVGQCRRDCVAGLRAASDGVHARGGEGTRGEGT
jgi:hypothetical protein